MFARTARLMLRPGWAEDAPALSRAIGDEAVVRNLSRAPWPYALGDAEAFLAADRIGALPDFLMFTRTRGAPRLVGGIGLMPAGEGVAELGYWVRRDHWGLGFATEAGRAVMSIAEDCLRLRRVVAGHFLDNPASGNVLRKLGFAATGQIEQRVSRARGAQVPLLVFERLCGERMMEDDRPLLAA